MAFCNGPFPCGSASRPEQSCTGFPWIWKFLGDVNIRQLVAENLVLALYVHPGSGSQFLKLPRLIRLYPAIS